MQIILSRMPFPAEVNNVSAGIQIARKMMLKPKDLVGDIAQHVTVQGEGAPSKIRGKIAFIKPSNLSNKVTSVYSTIIHYPEDRKIGQIQRQIDLKFNKIKKLEKERENPEISKSRKLELNAAISTLHDQIAEDANAIKTINASAKIFQQIAQGKAKKVYLEYDVKSKSSVDDNNVYYAPVGSDFVTHWMKKKEISEELKTGWKIQKKLGLKEGVEANIAFDMEVLEKRDEKVGVDYTVKTSKATGDLDAAFKKGSLKFPGSAQIGLDIVNGMHNLHRAGYVHGDAKGENVLLVEIEVDGKKRLAARIADLGKAQKLEAGQTAIHVGNPCYAAPEGGVSHKAEVYSTAIMVIHALEGELKSKAEGPDGMLLNVAENEQDEKVNVEARSGIEKFLVLNKNCLQKSHSTFQGKAKVLGGEVANKLGISKRNSAELEAAEKAVHSYIDKLEEGLLENHKGKGVDAEIRQLCELLKNMTKSTERPESLEEVVGTYQAIMQEIEKKT